MDSAWASGEASVYIDFAATNPPGVAAINTVPGGPGIAAFNSAYIAAMDLWSNNSVFRYVPLTSGVTGDPCNGSASGASFDTAPCSGGFGANTLAIQTTYYTLANETVRTVTVFNNSKQWDIYSGPWTGVNEFRRVAAHELGHGLGLDHSSFGTLMYFQAGNAEQPQADDIAGAAALYDIDGDGIGLADDNCPDISNSSQSDLDSDQLGDPCDPDKDGDGVPDAEDNCPALANTLQEDNEGDGAGDICDTDDDNDTLSDSDEINLYGTDPFSADTDGDGFDDGLEVQVGSDPLNPDYDIVALPWPLLLGGFALLLGLGTRLRRGQSPTP